MGRVWQAGASAVYGADDARPPPSAVSSSRRRPRLIDRLSPLRCALLTAVPALLYRVFLATVYFGWEEGDYGNLGLILGTAESGFSYIETEHMPLYTMV